MAGLWLVLAACALSRSPQAITQVLTTTFCLSFISQRGRKTTVPKLPKWRASCWLSLGCAWDRGVWNAFYDFSPGGRTGQCGGSQPHYPLYSP